MKRKAWFKIVTIFLAVMCVFMSVTISPKAAPCSIVRNQKIQYDQYIPGAMSGYGTFVYFVVDNNGFPHIAYCVNSMAAAKTTANYDDIVIDGNTNQLLYKTLYYGFKGQGDITDTQFPGASINFRYLVTHIAAGYAYNGTYKGISDSVATSSGVAAFIVEVNNMPMPAVANPEIHIIPEHTNAQGIVEQAIAYVNETKPQTDGGLTVNKTGEVLTKLENGRFVWEEGGIPGAVYEVTKNGTHVCDLTTDNSGSAYFEGYMAQVMERNWLDVPIELSDNDVYLTLSSCSKELAGSGTNRMVVMAKKLDKDFDYTSIVERAKMRENPLLPQKLRK